MVNLIHRIVSMENVWRQYGEWYFLWTFYVKFSLEIVWALKHCPESIVCNHSLRTPGLEHNQWECRILQWFHSKAMKTVEMTTTKHYMYLTKFCELLACQCYSSEELKILFGTYTFVSFYFDCNVSNLEGLEPASLKIKRTGGVL